MASGEINKLVRELRKFAANRDWNQFHSPKNLSMALSAEVAEIVEHFQWLTEKESGSLSRKKRAELENEIGDVLIYLLRLSDKLGVDPMYAARKKLRQNARKYPIRKAKGNAMKYTEFSD